MLAFIHAASISTAVFRSSGVRLSLSQSCSLYVGQCACNRHHTGCYRTSRQGEKRCLCHVILNQQWLLFTVCVHLFLLRAQRKVFSRFICHSQQCRNELASSTPTPPTTATPTPSPENTSSRNDAFLHGLHRAACIDE